MISQFMDLVELARYPGAGVDRWVGLAGLALLAPSATWLRWKKLGKRAELAALTGLALGWAAAWQGAAALVLPHLALEQLLGFAGFFAGIVPAAAVFAGITLPLLQPRITDALSRRLVVSLSCIAFATAMLPPLPLLYDREAVRDAHRAAAGAGRTLEAWAFALALRDLQPRDDAPPVVLNGARCDPALTVSWSEGSSKQKRSFTYTPILHERWAPGDPVPAWLVGRCPPAGELRAPLIWIDTASSRLITKARKQGLQDSQGTPVLRRVRSPGELEARRTGVYVLSAFFPVLTAAGALALGRSPQATRNA